MSLHDFNPARDTLADLWAFVQRLQRRVESGRWPNAVELESDTLRNRMRKAAGSTLVTITGKELQQLLDETDAAEAAKVYWLREAHRLLVAAGRACP